MYIPLKEDIKIIPIRGFSVVSEKNILTERAHAYDEQYIWARKCAEIAYECLMNGEDKANIFFNNAKDDDIKGAYLHIKGGNMLKTSGAIRGIRNDCVEIEISANRNITDIPKENAIKEITDAIAHELMHGKIYWERDRNGQELFDTPETYDRCISILNSETNPESLTYQFAYALYSTYYHEIQAMVSQTYTDIVKIIYDRYGKVMKDKEVFIGAMMETNTYKTYNQNMRLSQRLMDSEGIRTILIRGLRRYGMDYGDEEIVRMAKRIERKSENALKAAYNNAYQYIYN